MALGSSMGSHHSEELGEEPLYCEAHHDEVFCSGSEDEYYGAPEHRRLRIEAKAVQFLDGQIPFLLSAKLRGPFDKGWENPWMSRRVQRQARHHQAQPQASQACFSAISVEAPRGGFADGANDALPDTQGTSLYPLPSPEITNPPSARKNGYLGEDDYCRIRRWREDVKSLPVMADPFWASQRNNGGDDAAASTTKPTEADWLRTRRSKKRGPDKPSESPSQRGSKIKRRQVGRLSIRGAESSSEPTQETNDRMQPVVHIDQGTTTLQPNNTVRFFGNVRTYFDRPVSAPRPAFCSFDVNYSSSEDEFYAPSPSAPRREAVTFAHEEPFETLVSGRQANSAKRSPLYKVVRGRLGAEDQRLDRAEDSQQNTQLPALQGGSAHLRGATRLSRSERQQDGSFNFHARPRSRPKQMESSQVPTSHVDLHDANTTLPDAQPRLSGSTPENLAMQNHGSQNETEGEPVAAHHVGKMVVQSSDTREVQANPGYMLQGAPVNERTSSTPEVREVATPPRQNNDQSGAMEQSHEVQAEPPQHACTQELSPVSMPRSSETISAPADKAHGDLILSTVNDTIVSDLDWSTYINTQDLSAVVDEAQSINHDTEKWEDVTHKADVTSDSDWSTCVDSEEITTVPGMAEDFFEAVVFANEARSPSPPTTDDTMDSDSDWATCLSASAHASPALEILQVNSGGVNECAGVSDPPTATDNNSTTISECPLDVPCSSASGHEIAVEKNIIRDLESTTALEARPDSPGPSAQYNIKTQAETQADLETQMSSFDPYATTVTIEPATPSSLKGNDGHASHNIEGPDTETRTEADIGAVGEAVYNSMDLSNQAQSPWHAGGDIDPRVAVASPKEDDIFDVIPAIAEPRHLQSPWVQGGIDLQPATTERGLSSAENPSTLIALANEALTISSSSACQTAWVADKVPSPKFSMSVKKFSDFMGISPVKNAASMDGSILRSSGTCHLLFEASESLKSRRRVTFAPLPGEPELSFAESATRDDSEIYQDLSYFDHEGNKTTSIRVARPSIRVVSPPPRDLNLSEVGELSDHDQKFASHFEAVSKLKKNPVRRAVRLLPSDSQQASRSQESDAMAEAFIQASQARKSAELAGTNSGVDVRNNLLRNKILRPVPMHPIEERENIEPVDDVSAVLDNLDDFIDNTWGVDTSADMEREKQPSERQQNSLANSLENVRDPMLVWNVNVWAE